jgi:hypothetical protein
LSLKIKVDGFLGLGLKIDSFGLVICASKLSQRFHGLGLKIKQAMVYLLHHKTDRRRMARDTQKNLAACFTVKQVELGFSSLPQNWQRSDDGWCTLHHHGGHMKMKLKMDESM